MIQFVRLLKDGKDISMSKRSGQYTTIKDLLSLVDNDVVRFMMVTRSSDTHFDFDLDQCLKDSDENPVFYIQYANARINSIIKKSGIKDLSTQNLDIIDSIKEVGLIKAVIDFEDVIKDSAENLAPHKLTFYLQNLAKEFHSYYKSTKILNNDKLMTRLILITTIKSVLSNGLSLLGSIFTGGNVVTLNLISLLTENLHILYISVSLVLVLYFIIANIFKFKNQDNIIFQNAKSATKNPLGYKDKTMLSNLYKDWWCFLIAPLEKKLIANKVSPNFLTVLSLFFSILTAVLYFYGLIFLASIFLLAGSTFDMLDGRIARMTNNQSDIGSFLDSVLDRLCESVVMIGIFLFIIQILFL